jgi:hypothetical protein
MLRIVCSRGNVLLNYLNFLKISKWKTFRVDFAFTQIILSLSMPL